MEEAGPLYQRNPLDAASWRQVPMGVTRDPFWTDENGILRFDAHPGQKQAMDSLARFILVLAGLQSGKTITGPWWMLREMAMCGPGDYLAASPTFPLMELKLLPEYEALFERRLRWGKLYKGYPPILVLNERGKKALFGSELAEETRILFGAGSKPESLESATVKAAHLDEAGQKQFKRASHEAVLGRLSIFRGRILYTTTPYVLGWLKNEVYDRAIADRKKAPDQREYELIQFASTMNPAFPLSEFEDMRTRLPSWKFGMRYLGQFERPAGLIYDVFDRARHVVPPFEVPTSWNRRFLGLDFGGVNTAGVFLAEEPVARGYLPRYFLYRTYHEGGRTAKEHAKALLEGEPHTPKAWGGAPSEGQWRREFASGGLKVRKPKVKEVEVGIDLVYGLIKQDRLIVFEDQLDFLDEISRYSRELDDNDEPTEEIEDKETFHLLDALRYAVPGLALSVRSGSKQSSYV